MAEPIHFHYIFKKEFERPFIVHSGKQHKPTSDFAPSLYHLSGFKFVERSEGGWGKRERGRGRGRGRERERGEGEGEGYLLIFFSSFFLVVFLDLLRPLRLIVRLLGSLLRVSLFSIPPLNNG